MAESGAAALTQLLEFLRPRERNSAATLDAGLKQPSLTFYLHVEHVFVELAASLNSCQATGIIIRGDYFFGSANAAPRPHPVPRAI